MLKISFEMILDELEQEQPEPQFELGDDLLFTGVQLYERGVKNLSPDNLYMCRSEELTQEALDSGCCFLCIHTPPLGGPDLKGRHVVLLRAKRVGLADVFNTIQRLFNDMREWHQKMHVSLIQNNNIQELLDLSEEVIGNPIVLVDLSFRLMAHTRHVKTDDEIYNEVVRRGYHPAHTIDVLTRNRHVEGIKKAKVIDVEFPLPMMTCYETMTRTFYIDNLPYAYLRMICSSHKPSKSLEERFNLLAESVEYYLQNNHSSDNVNHYMYEYVLAELIERKIEDEATLQERLRFVGLQKHGQYQLLKLDFDDEDNTSLSYVQEQLLAIFPESRPFLHGSNIVVLMNFENKYNSPEHIKEHQFKMLGDFLAYHLANCGLSQVFSSIIQVSDAYVQATASLELGKQLRACGVELGGDSPRMFYYRDYLVYHLISSCAQQVHLGSLCDPQLLAIREQDRQKSTNYAHLLYTYLINECKPTDTARLLHMHRNNVIYHVERLSEQLGVDLSDPATRLRLLLSFKVLALMDCGKEPNDG